MQAISACSHCRPQTVEERKPLFEDTRQLYATEAEDYFFYFVPVREDEVIGIAI